MSSCAGGGASGILQEHCPAALAHKRIVGRGAFQCLARTSEWHNSADMQLQQTNQILRCINASPYFQRTYPRRLNRTTLGVSRELRKSGSRSRVLGPRQNAIVVQSCRSTAQAAFRFVILKLNTVALAKESLLPKFIRRPPQSCRTKHDFAF